MDEIKKAKLLAKNYIENYPNLKSDINGLLSLMIDEILDGGSPNHEFELFAESLNELVEQV